MWDGLISQEKEYCQYLLNDLKNIQWIKPLISKIENSGGISPETKPLLFELRFAAELYHLGLSVDYEYKTGVNNSTVDFRIEVDDFSWLVELVSIRTSNVVKNATQNTGPFSSVTFISDARTLADEKEKKRSKEGETILVQQKIGEKVYSNGNPIKFPPISNNVVFSLILTDMRGYLGGNCWDYGQIAYGESGVPPEYREIVHCWTNSNGKLVPIKGIFDKDNNLRAAKTLQERIELLGFVGEKEYGQGKLLSQIYYYPNPILFLSNLSCAKAVKVVLDKTPFTKERACQLSNSPNNSESSADN